MTTITIDAQMLDKLLGLKQPLTVCDERGKLLGTFTPLSERQRAELARPPLSSDELARRRLEPDYSTVEVIERLESL